MEKITFEDLETMKEIHYPFDDFEFECKPHKTTISEIMFVLLKQLVPNHQVKTFNKVLHIVSVNDDHIHGIYQLDEFYWIVNFYYG